MRDALESVKITEINTNVGDRTVSFVAPAGMDVEVELNKLVDVTAKLKDWTKSD